MMGLVKIGKSGGSLNGPSQIFLFGSWYSMFIRIKWVLLEPLFGRVR